MTEITTRMGAASSYTTLKLAAVKATTLRDEGEYQAWDMPAAAVIGREVTYALRSHGVDAISGGGPHFAKTHPYWLIALNRCASQDEARQHAKILAARLESALREIIRSLFLQDTRGERTEKQSVIRSSIYTWPERNGPANWLGIAMVSAEFETFI